MSFKPFPCPDRWRGILAMLGLAALDVVFFFWLIGRQVDGLSFLLALTILVSLLFIAYIGYRTAGTFTLEYWVDRDRVTLVWGATRQTVPMGEILRVLHGTDARPRQKPRLWHWPCRFRRRFISDKLGVINAYATRPLDEQIILVTAAENYGLSPTDPQGFLDALQQRFALGVARPLTPTLQRPPLWTWPLWRDRSALWVLGLGLLGVVLMFGALCFRYPSLSADLPLHFDVTGLPDRIAAKSGLFALPLIGLVTWVFNTATGVWLYRHVQHGAAYLLWGGALVVQGIAALALFILMQW